MRETMSQRLCGLYGRRPVCAALTEAKVTENYPTTTYYQEENDTPRQKPTIAKVYDKHKHDRTTCMIRRHYTKGFVTKSRHRNSVLPKNKTYAPLILQRYCALLRRYFVILQSLKENKKR